MILFALVFLAESAKALPFDLGRRQIASWTAPGSSGGGDKSNAVPLSAIIAISSILGVVLIGFLLVSTFIGFRGELTCQYQFLRCKSTTPSRRQMRRIRAAALVPLTAEDLAGTGIRDGRSDVDSTSNVVGTGNGRRARRSRGRALRRTESGRSVKTLPEYSKEAGAEELVLVR